MTLFHQSAPHLVNQLKGFQPRISQLNDTVLPWEDDDEFFGAGKHGLGISVIAFLPVAVISIMLITLLVFFRMRSYRSTKEQINRLEQVYDDLECVKRVNRHWQGSDEELLARINRAVVQDDDDDTPFFQPTRKIRALKFEQAASVHRPTSPNDLLFQLTRLSATVEENRSPSPTFFARAPSPRREPKKNGERRTLSVDEYHVNRNGSA